MKPKFRNKKQLFEYYRAIKCDAVDFNQVIDESGFRFNMSCLELTEETLIAVWVYASEYLKQDKPDYLARAAKQVWREYVLTSSHKTSKYWDYREGTDMEADMGEYTEEDHEGLTEHNSKWFIDAILSEIDCRGLGARVFELAGVPYTGESIEGYTFTYGQTIKGKP